MKDTDAGSEQAPQLKREIVARAARLRAEIKAESGVLADSAPFIREDRDRRG